MSACLVFALNNVIKNLGVDNVSETFNVPYQERISEHPSKLTNHLFDEDYNQLRQKLLKPSDLDLSNSHIIIKCYFVLFPINKVKFIFV